MFKFYISLLVFITLLIAKPAMSQSIEGLKEIVSFQQEKISRIEDNLKALVGSIEDQSNVNRNQKKVNIIESQLNSINEKIKFLENNIINITNLSYNLDFALKRIERHLELKSINDNSYVETKPSFKKDGAVNVEKKSLDAKTSGVLGFIKNKNDLVDESKNDSIADNKVDKKNKSPLPKGTSEENYNYALDLARQLDFKNAEKAFKEFLIVHKDTKQQADAQYWLGRVYFAQNKYEEAAIAMAEFNSVFPDDSRFQETTLLIAEAAVNFAPKNQLCDILNQSLEFMINPSDKFVKRINFLQNEKQCSAE
jgi:TolA-binding protein